MKVCTTSQHFGCVYTSHNCSNQEIEPTLEEAEGSEGSQSSGNVLAIILGVVGSLLVLSIVVIVAIYVIRKKKLLPTYKPHQSGMGGIGKSELSDHPLIRRLLLPNGRQCNLFK